jgi:hypothetical protein
MLPPSIVLPPAPSEGRGETRFFDVFLEARRLKKYQRETWKTNEFKNKNFFSTKSKIKKNGISIVD